MLKARLMLAGAMLAGLSLSQTGAHAAVIAAVPGNSSAPYLPTAAPAGTALTYANLDPLQPHNVVSVAQGKVTRSYCTATQTTQGTCPLFATGKTTAGIAFGGTAPIVGSGSLPAGSYEFFCGLHPGVQRGTLTVV